MYHVLLTEIADLLGYENPALDIESDLSLSNNADELLRRSVSKDAIIVRNATHIDSDMVAKLRESTKVRVVGRLGAGLDNIDVVAARNAGIEVVYAPNANTESTAQFVLSQILSVSRHLREANESTRHGKWNRLAFVGRDLAELSFGIVGYGRIGSRLAEILEFFGADVAVHTRRPECLPPRLVAKALPELFSSSDVISLHVPLSATTRGLVGRSLLDLMKPKSILVNTSRGEIIQEQCLQEFLSLRSDVSAVLDVRQAEPPKDELFRYLPNAHLSPHIAAFTAAAQKQVIFSVLNDVECVLSGGCPKCPAP